MPLAQPELSEFLELHNTAWRHVVDQSNGRGSKGLCLRVKDIREHPGVTLKLPNPHVDQEETLVSGDFFRMELRRGLSLHYSDALEHPYSVTAQQPAGLSCLFLLKGEMDLQICDRRFSMTSNKQFGSISAVSAFKTADIHLERTVHHTQRVRKIILHATRDWLQADGQQFDQLLNQPIATHCGIPTVRQLQFIEEIFKPTVYPAALLPLYLESRVIEVLAESLSLMMNRTSAQENCHRLSNQDQTRLQRARKLIDDFERGPLTVDIIARETGISASGLQKLFRRVEGVSVFEYVRRTRLRQALRSLQTGNISVQEVSSFAGYKSPENFATAFKRQFGITPRQASRGGLKE